MLLAAGPITSTRPARQPRRPAPRCNRPTAPGADRWRLSSGERRLAAGDAEPGRRLPPRSTGQRLCRSTPSPITLPTPVRSVGSAWPCGRTHRCAAGLAPAGWLADRGRRVRGTDLAAGRRHRGRPSCRLDELAVAPAWALTLTDWGRTAPAGRCHRPVPLAAAGFDGMAGFNALTKPGIGRYLPLPVSAATNHTVRWWIRRWRLGRRGRLVERFGPGCLKSWVWVGCVGVR